LSKLFEIYIFDDSLAIGLEKEIGDYISASIGKGMYDLVLALDYGHGLLTPKLIQLLSGCDIFLAVNAQSNTASVGYNPISKYPRANYFCLGEQELQLAFQDRHTDLQILAERLASQVSLPGAVSVTRGWRGAFIFDAAKKLSHSTPALSHKIVDTVGAGDALFSITSLCVAMGLPLDLVGFIGNAAGSLAIEIIGNKTPIEPNQLYDFIRTLLKEGGKE
jgi:sugar/nucleoside kinase (ribokinase family)